MLSLGVLALPETAESRASDGRWVATDWVRHYHGPNSLNGIKAMKVDDQGNVYVTGSSYSASFHASAYLTIKYNSQGQVLWANTYTSPEIRFADYLEALVIDGLGNVYVTGNSGIWNQYEQYSSITTIKYSPDGQELWVKNYHEPDGAGVRAMTIDGQGNIYITGSSWRSLGHGSYTYEPLTVKYAPDGQVLWVRKYSAEAMAVDPQGNVYATGTSMGSGTGHDIDIFKFNPDGQRLWVRHYNGPGNGNDYVKALKVDTQGNVYVTGSSQGSETGYDYVTVKYSTDGRRLWARRYRSVGNGTDTPVAIAVDPGGNVFVTGEAPDDRMATVKYNPDGKRLWVKNYAGLYGASGAATMAVDGQGNVYVTGNEWGEGPGNCVTIKYGSDGKRLWITRYNRSDNLGDGSHAMALDGRGNVYIGGSSEVFDFYIYDFLLIKYKQTP